MGKVILDMSMSLDGFISGLNHEDVGLYNWYFAPSGGSQKVIDELVESLGAIIMGRRTYGVGDDQGGYEDNPYSAVNLVLTHHPPEKLPTGATKFIFVTDGIESALTQARAAAGERDVAIGGGANVAQQYLRAGLIDEIQIHFVPSLLGQGIRLFEHLSDKPLELEITRVIEAPDVTHVLYRVVK